MDGLSLGIMTGIITSFLALSALQAFRSPDLAAEGKTGITLTFGNRYRLFWCLGMLLGFNGTYVLFAKAPYSTLWIPAVLSVLLCSVFYYYLHNAFVYRVTLTAEGVTVRELFRGETHIEWKEVRGMRYSRSHHCLVIAGNNSSARVSRFVDGTDQFKAKIPGEIAGRFGDELACL
ncbi:MAG: PH domain-containing protein [Pseudomonadota bacterium]